MRCWPLLVLACAAPGCSTLDPSSCPAGLKRAPTAELFFGRNIVGGGFVSDADWTRFLDQEVTPRFPDGLSVFDVQGQWRLAPSGPVVRERSKDLFLVLPEAKDNAAKLSAIREAYKARFKQVSVLLIRRTACVAF